VGRFDRQAITPVHQPVRDRSPLAATRGVIVSVLARTKIRADIVMDQRMED
jgi:hypothetical protein